MSFFVTFPENVRSNLNVAFFQSADDSDQSVGDLPKQSALNGKFECQEEFESAHDGEYSRTFMVIKRVQRPINAVIGEVRTRLCGSSNGN